MSTITFFITSLRPNSCYKPFKITELCAMWPVSSEFSKEQKTIKNKSNQQKHFSAKQTFTGLPGNH